VNYCIDDDGLIHAGPYTHGDVIGCIDEDGLIHEGPYTHGDVIGNINSFDW
jgi:hypothetical protein